MAASSATTRFAGRPRPQASAGATVQAQRSPGTPPAYRPAPPQVRRSVPMPLRAANSGHAIQRMNDDDDYAPPPRPTLWDWVRGPLARAEFNRHSQQATVVNLPPLPPPQVAVTVQGPVPRQGVLVRAPVPQQAVLVPAPQPTTPVLTPGERARNRAATAPVPTQPARAPRRNRGTRLVLTAPDVGGHLGTRQITHAVFRDIVFFTLNNNPPYTEIHVHRNGAGQAVQISMKVTGQTGNGTAVPYGSPLFNAAAAAASRY